ncbi:Ig-like domain-containing protein [Salegentibacter chungangensis]|uniref:Ig-like domain-containing protein n=1 Tax=Salegentibacter chungangensis TaxID=1335724 RepID=A0ABW3NPU8_9FLAO
MGKRIQGFLLVIILCFGITQCAKKGMPKGGPKDEEPPKFVRATPENFSTNFSKEEIRIYFNEYIKIENPQKQIIISPPMDPKPSILPLGSARKDIKIEIFDTLQENTTYTINFGKSIVDNNEGNPMDYFKYVFSTGDYIDSLEVGGSVSDAYLKAPKEVISVFLYEIDTSFTDSLVYKENPRYMTYANDSTFNFKLENLKEGKYQMLAVMDLNNNYNYDPKKEKIGFISDYIDLPNDSTFTISVFKEELAFEPKRPKQFKGQQLIFGYEGKTDLDSVKIDLINPKPEGFASRIVKDAKKDTLYYWYKPKIETDTLRFKVTSPKRTDTLITRLGEAVRDSLIVTGEPSGTIEYQQDFKFKANTPITEANTDLIEVLDEDSTAIPFTTELKLLENELLLKFDKKEDNQYYIKALPGAITDLFEATNDTIRTRLKTKPYSDYGNVVLRLQNVSEYPVIAQLTNPKGEVQAEKYSTGENTLNFQFMKPGKFLVRIIFDKNENQKWDTGDYLKKRQPERIEYFNDTLEVRANWDINQSIILD